MIEKKETEAAWEEQMKTQGIKLREISDSMKRSNIRIIGILEGVERERDV